MKKKRMYISGELEERGIDGQYFRIDYSYIADSSKLAYACRDRINSTVFELVPVRIRINKEKSK